MIKFDEYSFEKTAEALLILNPHAVEFIKDSYRRDGNNNPTKEQMINRLKSYMEQFAMTYSSFGEKTTYCGTMGFYVTVYNLGYESSDYTVGAAVNVSPSLVLDYMNRMKRNFEVA